jgi:hypothetical protein
MPSGVLNSKQISASFFSGKARDGDAQHRRAGLYAREQQRF